MITRYAKHAHQLNPACEARSFLIGLSIETSEEMSKMYSKTGRYEYDYKSEKSESQTTRRK